MGRGGVFPYTLNQTSPPRQPQSEEALRAYRKYGQPQLAFMMWSKNGHAA